MPRPIVVVALAAEESGPVAAELSTAGFQPVAVGRPGELAAYLDAGLAPAVAILDGEADLSTSLEYYELLHQGDRAIPALMVLDLHAFERLSSSGAHGVHDELMTRPFTADSIRWRIEAMIIRSATVDDGTGEAVLSGDVAGGSGWAGLANVIVVFNPKGGVGKTTVATNLAAALCERGDQRVLLVDADTVTGHILSSLGIEAVGTLADAWRDEADGGEPAPSVAELAAHHSSGMRVLALTNSPLFVDVLEPTRVAAAINHARRAFDVVVVDLHPSYSQLNRAIFEIADRILVPVTPDVPAIRAAIQLREIAVDLGIRERLAMVVNRVNSGVSLEDLERTIGMTAFARINSGGLVFVKAANEGRTVIDRFPKERVSDDFRALARALVAPAGSEAEPAPSPRAGFRLFSRVKEAARA
jgi:pilus assembly protein CpaE